jgi:hypothetical protein
MITLCESFAFAYTVSVTASPPESAVEIDKTTDVFNVCGSFSEDTTQRQESETTKCRWKYIDATVYSDEQCETVVTEDTVVVSVTTPSDTEWSTDEIYTKNVTVEGLKVGINWIKFNMKYQINETGEGTELITIPVKIFVYDIGFIDNIPDYSLDANKDSDNFFLRQHDETTGTADYKDLDIYYYILPEGLPVSDVKITIREEEEEAENKFVKQIDGEKTDGNYKTGDELNVKWPDVRDAAGDFRENRFYTVQLEVDVNGVDETFKTPLGDANTAAKGYQCQEKCLVIHDLVFKHRPVVHTSVGETVAPKGPIYPFSGGLQSNYQLWKRGRTGYGGVAWTTPLPNYSVLGSFPTIPFADRVRYGHYYDVLDASITNDHAGSSDHYIDINMQLSTYGNVSLFHRGHPSGTLASRNSYCFIQFWMFSTQSYSPYRRPTWGNDVEASFHHEGDWEMVQICVKLSGTTKSEWFLPHAATASQHYYGQTLAWRIDNNGPEIIPQKYVSTYDNGNRVLAYIAINGHATYFRMGEFDAAVTNNDSCCGTQIQYDPVYAYFDKFNATLNKITEPALIPLNKQSERDIADWPGYWGQSGWEPGTQGPNGPFKRAAKAKGGGYLNLNSEPMRFHDECRKLIGGTPQPETGL